MKPEPTAAVLLRLRRKIMKERRFSVGVAKSAKERHDMTAVERAVGEANVLYRAVRLIDEEIKKAGGAK